MVGGGRDGELRSIASGSASVSGSCCCAEGGNRGGDGDSEPRLRRGEDDSGEGTAGWWRDENLRIALFSGLLSLPVDGGGVKLKENMGGS